MKERDPYIDILKAIGIISIVIGHASINIPGTNIEICKFVYAYHLMIFFFTAGFCFKKEYAAEPYQYIGRRLKSMLPLYFKYNLIFVLLHNLFVRYHFVDEGKGIYGIQEGISQILSAVAFTTAETFLGAFWFVPLLFFALGLFVICFYWAEKWKKPVLGHGVLIVLAALVGLFLCKRNVQLPYRLQIAVLGIPILYLGYFCKSGWGKVSRFVKWYGAIASGVVVYLVVTKVGMIELSVNSIISPILFYPVTVLGIYFCLGLGKLLLHCRLLSRGMAVIGQNSFHIMALHLMIFKIVDLVYILLTRSDIVLLETYPHSFELWIIYYIAGVGIPVIIIMFLKKVGSCLKAKLKINIIRTN